MRVLKKQTRKFAMFRLCLVVFNLAAGVVHTRHELVKVAKVNGNEVLLMAVRRNIQIPAHHRYRTAK